MPFGVVSGVGRGMGVLAGGGDRRREGLMTSCVTSSVPAKCVVRI